MLICISLSHDLVTIITLDASASPNATIQELNTSDSQNTSNLTGDTVTPPPALNATTIVTPLQVQAIGSITDTVLILIVGIALLIVAPLILSMIRSNSTNMRQFRLRELYRLLVAVGVTFTVILIIAYLNAMASTLIVLQSSNVDTVIGIMENFTTIIGTAFASLIAFYFGTRGTQNRNSEQNGNTSRTTTPTATGLGTPQKAPEVIDINPIDGTVGVEVNSPVTVTFSTSIRTSTINENTFSVKDANGNRKQGNITPTDNNTTIRFNPVPSFN